MFIPLTKMLCHSVLMAENIRQAQQQDFIRQIKLQNLQGKKS